MNKNDKSTDKNGKTKKRVEKSANKETNIIQKKNHEEPKRKKKD